jgi:hypothetical protein
VSAPKIPSPSESTPLNIIANVTRIVTRAADNITGDRHDYPLLVARGLVHALYQFGIGSRVAYGSAAWIETLENGSLHWTGCWGGNFHFWVLNAYGETIDLNCAVSNRGKIHSQPDLKPKYSPPILWSKGFPRFYKYQAEGFAEVENLPERDARWEARLNEEIELKCRPALLTEDEEFPNEAILCPDRRILDDTGKSFQHYDRALSVLGIPEGPKF